MAPVGSYPLSSSSDAAAGVRTGSARRRSGSERPSPRLASAPLPQAFDVRCADIHPVGCEQALRASRPATWSCSRASSAGSCTATRRSGTAPGGLPRGRSGDLATELTVPPRSASRPNSRAPQGSRGRRSPASHGDAGVPVAMTHCARSADHASAAGARPDDRRWRPRSAILSSPQVGASERSPRRACGGPR